MAKGICTNCGKTTGVVEFLGGVLCNACKKAAVTNLKTAKVETMNYLIGAMGGQQDPNTVDVNDVEGTIDSLALQLWGQPVAEPEQETTATMDDVAIEVTEELPDMTDATEPVTEQMMGSVAWIGIIVQQPVGDEPVLTCKKCSGFVQGKAQAMIRNGAVAEVLHTACSPVEAKQTKVTKTVAKIKPCECGCGGSPKNSKSRFIQGHDSKFHSAQKTAAKAAAEWAVLAATMALEQIDYGVGVDMDHYEVA